MRQKVCPTHWSFSPLFLVPRRRSTSSACTGATAVRRRRPKRRGGTTAARAAPTWSVTTGWTGPSSRACTGCWRLGPAAPSSTPTPWPTAPSPCWTRAATVWSPSATSPAGWVGWETGQQLPESFSYRFRLKAKLEFANADSAELESARI